MQPLLTTPGKNYTSARSQSGSVNYLLSDVRGDLNADLSNTQACGLDNLIQHFIYQVLDPESAQKKKLDELQAEIELLEEEVHSPKEEDTPDIPLPDDSTADERSMPNHPRLRELYEKRSQILSAVYDQCLTAVLPICNNATVYEHVQNYTKEGPEDQRYGPFVRACNSALGLMTKLHTRSQLPLRGPSALDIRFKRNDPRHISHQYKGATAATWRKPDVIITSRTSACDAVAKGGEPPRSEPTQKRKREGDGQGGAGAGCGGADDQCGQEEKEYESAPTVQEGFGWQDVLSCSEFKRVLKVLKCAPEPSYEDTDRKVTLPANDKELDLPVGSSDGPSLASTQSSSKGQGSFTNSNDHRGAKKRKVDSVQNKRLGSSLSIAKTMMENRKKAGSSGALSKSANFGAGQSQEALSARAQCASYGLEMMSNSIGVHHAINLFFADTHMWIFYFDRQGILQSDGIDFIQDLPRFLVLLLAFQRFELKDWGVIPELNPSPSLVHEPHPPLPPRKEPTVRTRAATSALAAEGLVEAQFKARHTAIEEFNLDGKTCLDINWKWNDPGEAKNQVDPTSITLKPRSFVSHQPHSLAGRATAVIDASIEGLGRDVVCKISNPEVQRTNEGDILREIYDNCDKHDASMKKHVPEMLLYGDIRGSLTNRVRSMVGIWNWRGHRTMRVMVLIKMHPLTTLVGHDFVKAWLETVKCHAFLWDHGIDHGDPSLWNLMYSTEHECGVLGDYDLAIFLDRPRVRGTDRTGTTTFMAIKLLNKKYWDGLIKRQYHHELEAFIWVLPFVFLRYQDRIAVPYTVVEEWMTSNYETCHEKKSSFLLNLNEVENRVQLDFKDVWPIAFELLSWVYAKEAPRKSDLSDSHARAGFVQALESVPSLGYLDRLLEYLRLAPSPIPA